MKLGGSGGLGGGGGGSSGSGGAGGATIATGGVAGGWTTRPCACGSAIGGVAGGDDGGASEGAGDAAIVPGAGGAPGGADAAASSCIFPVAPAPGSCDYTIPPPPNGQAFDPAIVNVTFTPKGGPAQDIGYVSAADCAYASDAWYFDNPNNPTQIFLCPSTCDMLKASTDAEVDVLFGCARRPAILH